MHDLCAISRERFVFRHRRLHAHLDAFEVGNLFNRLLAVHMAQALAAEAKHVGTLHLGRIQLAHGPDYLGIAKDFDRMRLVAENKVDRKDAGFRLRGRSVGG